MKTAVKTVWVVEDRTGYESGYVAGVFSTKGYAEAYVRAAHRDLDISEMTLDEHLAFACVSDPKWSGR